MYKLKLFSCLGFLSLVFPLAVLAQESGQTSYSNPLPNIFVYNLTVKNIAGSKVVGEFQVSNESKEIQSDLVYTISVIDKEQKLEGDTFAPESFNIYDKKTERIEGTFAVAEKKTVSFEYDVLQSLPKGEYRLRVRVGTVSGQQLGWDDANVQIGSGEGFIILSPVSIKAEGGTLVDGELNKKGEAGPLDGVDIEAGKDITFNFSLSTLATKKLEGNLLLETYDWNGNGSALATERGTSVSVAKGKAVSGQFAAKSQMKAGSYYVVLSVVNEKNEKISSLAEYRYVVKGSSGRVVSASIKEFSDKQVVVQAEVVGPADRLSILDGARVRFYLLDGDNVVTQAESKALNLGTENMFSVTQALSLDKAVSDLSLKVELVNQEGNTVHSYGYKVDNAPVVEQPTVATKNTTNIWVLIAALVISIVAVGVVVFLLLRPWLAQRHSGVETKVLSIGLVFLGVAASAYGVSNIVRAQGQITNYIPEETGSAFEYHGVRLFVNKPINNNTYSSHVVPVQADIFWQHCNNRPSQGWLYVDYFTEGGHMVPKADPKTVSGGQREWWPSPVEKDFASYGIPIAQQYIPANLPASRWTKLIDYKTNVCNACGSLVQQRTYSGQITLPETMEKATLRWLSFKKHITDWQAWVNVAAYYSWLDFVVPTPTPSPTLDFSASPNPVSYNTASDLTWTSVNTTSCTASGDWSGSKSLSGNQSTGNITSAKIYTLTCEGTPGTTPISRSVTVNVGSSPAPSPTPTSKPGTGPGDIREL